MTSDPFSLDPLRIWARATSVVFLVLALILAGSNVAPAVFLVVAGTAVGLYGWRAR